MDNIIPYFITHWRGQLSIGKAGWLSSFVAILLVLPTNLLEISSFLSINHIHSFDDIMARIQDGNIDLMLPPFIIQALNQIVEITVLVWWSVGAWRCCNNPENNRHGKDSFWFFKTMIVVTAAFDLYGLYDFVTTIMGS